MRRDLSSCIAMNIGAHLSCDASPRHLLPRTRKDDEGERGNDGRFCDSIIWFCEKRARLRRIEAGCDARSGASPVVLSLAKASRSSLSNCLRLTVCHFRPYFMCDVRDGDAVGL